MKLSFRSSFLCVIALLGGLFVPLTISGCNAVEGLGKDLQESSENVRQAVKNADDD